VGRLSVAVRDDDDQKVKPIAYVQPHQWSTIIWKVVSMVSFETQNHHSYCRPM